MNANSQALPGEQRAPLVLAAEVEALPPPTEHQRFQAVPYPDGKKPPAGGAVRFPDDEDTSLAQRSSSGRKDAFLFVERDHVQNVADEHGVIGGRCQIISVAQPDIRLVCQGLSRDLHDAPPDVDTG